LTAVIPADTNYGIDFHLNSTRLAEEASDDARPLAGCRILDLTRILSGPYATMLLADLGADVIKVERPGVGDDTRHWGPPFWRAASTYFSAVNRGKRSLAVDLGTDAGRELVVALAERCDLVVENFRPGVAERLGLGYARLAAGNPGLIYASISGFGSHGPKASEAGTEVIVEAETGLMAMTGVAGGPPVRFPVAMVDIATGMMLVNGVLAALLRRVKTGRGRRLEFPLYSTAISVLATVIASASIEPASQEDRWGSGHPSIVPYSAFLAGDGYVVLGAINESMWHRLCSALGLEALRTDSRCASNEERVRNRDFVETEIAQALASMPVAEVTRRLRECGALVAPVKTAWEASADPQVQALGLIDIDDGVRFARTPLAQFGGEPLSRAPALGEHTREVLRDELGVDDARLRALVEAGVVATTNGATAVLQTGEPVQSVGAGE
jgi:crotonobetainyl-CoA:carnitine CoA-transferase CaiB-like acyl-CoA transferase